MNRQKFAKIETLPMFDEPPRRSKQRRTPGPRSVAFATCSKCHTPKPVGLVRVGEHLIWRPHNIVTWSGARQPCPASGVAVCITPAKQVTKGAARCPHGEGVWSGNDGAA
jgi:hypothetical protein